MALNSENMLDLFGEVEENGSSEYKKTIMIIGISSFVGSNLAHYLKNHFRVIGTYYNNPIQINGVLTFRLDILNKDAIDKVIFIFKPDIVIYNVGLSNLSECEEEQKIADALNTVGVFNVTSATERFSSKLIYISSCYVFAGEEEENYEEQDSPMPSSIYGATVAASEFYIQKSCLNYLIFRCTPFFGRSYHYFKMNFFEFLEQKFFKGESFYADNKIKTGFFDIYLLGKIIKHVIDQGYSNRLFQVTSSDHMTRYEFACLVAEILGKDPKLISKKNSKFPFNEDKIFTVDFTGVGNFTMNASNLEVTAGIKLPSIKEMLLSYFKILGIEDGKKAGKAAGSGGISYI